MGNKDPFDWVGATIEGKFRVDAVVGEGGFGVVYRGHHLGFDEAVAIKCLKVPASMLGEERERFLKTFLEEGRLMHRLSRATSGIVQALDVGAAVSPGGTWTPFLVLEWLHGTPLDLELAGRTKRGEGGRALAEAVELLTPAARALDAAHAAGVAHRDVKPANLFLADVGEHRTVKVLDFGIAKVLSEVSTLTQALAETGSSVKAFTPQYGAPEQFHRRFGATGPWTDVYALALVLVEAVTGRAALDGSDTTQLFIASTDLGARPTLRGSGVDVSDEVEAVMKKALAVDPRDRYMRAGVFWDELLAAMPEGSVARRDSKGAGVSGARAHSKPELPEGYASMPTGEFIAQHDSGPKAATTTSGAFIPPPSERAKMGFAPTTPSENPDVPSAARKAKDTVDVAVTGPESVARTSEREGPIADRAPPPPPAGSRAMLWGILVVFVLAGGAGAFIASRPAPPPPPAIASAAPVVSASAAPDPVGPAMVRVPAGVFSMGSETGGKTERPVHKVTFTKAFDIDRTEVTAADYQTCVSAGKCAPSSIHGPKVDDDEIAKFLPLCTALDPSKAHHPVNCVDQAQAMAYCKFAGKRLPTEAEWEYAARGNTDARDYPWGNDAPGCDKAAVARAVNDKCERPHGTAEVGRFPEGKSPFGALDMAGNVWEWVADGWDANSYSKGAVTDPLTPQSMDNGILRGGSWDFAAQTAKSTFRLAFNRSAASVSTGMRCAKTVE